MSGNVVSCERKANTKFRGQKKLETGLVPTSTKEKKGLERGPNGEREENETRDH